MRDIADALDERDSLRAEVERLTDTTRKLDEALSRDAFDAIAAATTEAKLRAEVERLRERDEARREALRPIMHMVEAWYRDRYGDEHPALKQLAAARAALEADW